MKFKVIGTNFEFYITSKIFNEKKPFLSSIKNSEQPEAKQTATKLNSLSTNYNANIGYKMNSSY